MNGLVRQSKFYDAGVADDANFLERLEPLLNLLDNVFGLYAVFGSCYVDKKIADATKWYENDVYNLQTEVDTSEEEGEGKDEEDAVPPKETKWKDLDFKGKLNRTIFWANLASRLIESGQGAWRNYAGGYYFYFSG